MAQVKFSLAIYDPAPAGQLLSASEDAGLADREAAKAGQPAYTSILYLTRSAGRQELAAQSGIAGLLYIRTMVWWLLAATKFLQLGTSERVENSSRAAIEYYYVQ